MEKINRITELMGEIHPMEEWVKYPNLTPRQIDILIAIGKGYRSRFLPYEPDMDNLINQQLLIRKGDKVFATAKGRVWAKTAKSMYRDKLDVQDWR